MSDDSPPASGELPLLALARGKLDDPSARQNVVRIRSFRGHKYVDLRSLYRCPTTGAMLHTRRGLTVRAGEIDEVIEALQRARVILLGEPNAAQVAWRPTMAGATER